jgi:peptide/nickel transport system substrate-binding protein
MSQGDPSAGLHLVYVAIARFGLPVWKFFIGEGAFERQISVSRRRWLSEANGGRCQGRNLLPPCWLVNVCERNETFWGRYPWYTKPQVRVIEIIRVPDGAARFAMLKSGQADVVLPTDLAIAKNLPRQPGKATWIQPLFGTAQALISFKSLLAAQEGQCPEEPFWSCWPKAKPDVAVGPFADIRVREALDIAIDKKTISGKIQGGLSTPTGSVFSLGSFGLRREVADRLLYDPARAKQLLHEAGYPQGFSTKLYFAKVRPGLSEYLESVVAYWHKIGVKADLIEAETST